MQTTHKAATRHPHKLRRAAARVRQLATLEATGPHLAPLLLRELREVLAFDSAGYFHPGMEGGLEAFVETSEAQAVLPVYFSDSMQQEVLRLTRSYAEAAAQELGPQSTLQLIKVPWARFVASDFYNVVLRPAGMRDCVSLMPRRDDGAPVGALKLYRDSPALTFRPDELQELARLEPYIAKALSPRPALPADDAYPLGTEMVVATVQGRLQWKSARGHAWMVLAFGHHWRDRAVLPDALGSLLQRLRWLRDGVSAEAPPALEVRNAYGQFTIRACLLASTGEAGDAAGIQISWQVSRSVRLLEALRGLDLPPRQAEVACLLALGLPQTEIAQRTDLSPHTVVYHRRQLYAALGVTSRAGLVTRLLADSCRAGA